MPREIFLVPYDPKWPTMFETEAALIKQALGDNCIAIYHIGSTSVPGLCSKPRLDIILVTKNPVDIRKDLENLEYSFRGKLNIPFRLFYTKRGATPEVNLHVYEDNSNPEIELNLLFRDYLRNNANVRDEYARLKLDLASQKDMHEKNDIGMRKYTLGKDAFIKTVLEKAGFSGLCMRICTHHDEWNAARIFRQKYFFDKVPVADPYTWTFNHKDHIHFVLYQGVNIIGYAHIVLWPEERAALRIIVIDEHVRNQGLGGHFLALCESWLKQKGIKRLHMQSSPEAYKFYLKQGYIEMPFNDSEGYECDPQDIDMGKVL